jgi:hypothetical protein
MCIHMYGLSLLCSYCPVSHNSTRRKPFHVVTRIRGKNHGKWLLRQSRRRWHLLSLCSTPMWALLVRR